MLIRTSRSSECIQLSCTFAVDWPRQQLSTHPATRPLPSQRDRGEHRKSKSKKTHRSRQRQFQEWKKRKNPKRCNSNHSPPRTSRTMPSQSLSNGYAGTSTTAFLMLCMTLYGMGYPRSAWDSFPGCEPFQPLALPQPTCRWQWDGGAVGRVRNRESLDAVQYCSASAKPLVCYQHCFSHKSKTQLHTGCHEKS